MGIRLGLVGHVAVIGAVIASAVPAPAAARGPGWRLAATFGKPHGSSVNEVTSNRPSDAWATGTWVSSRCSCQELLTARLDGRSWQVLKPPSPFALTGPLVSAGTAIAGLSTSYSWTFLVRQALDGSASQDWALRWRSGHWQPFQLADASEITSAVVFSGSSAWGFGVRSSHAYAVHFNGRTWRRVPIPVGPES